MMGKDKKMMIAAVSQVAFHVPTDLFWRLFPYRATLAQGDVSFSINQILEPGEANKGVTRT